MKKTVAALLAVLFLMSVFAGHAETNWGTKTLNEAEIAGSALAMFLGEPMIIDSEKGSALDEINARYVYILDDEPGFNLALAIRTSDEQMYFWGLELTPENLMKVKLAFDKDAPICSLLRYEGNEIKDSAVYYKSLSSILPYEDFEKDVDRVVASLSAGDLNAASDAVDPVLSCFPGLSWGMTIDEILNTLGKEQFTISVIDSGVSLKARPVIYGESVLILFIFKDKKLNMFSANCSEDKIDRYIDDLTKAYGTPHKTSIMGALMGQLGTIKDDPSGDCYAWKTDKSLIIVDGNTVQYWSLY